MARGVAKSVWFGLAMLGAALLPTRTGFQDLGASDAAHSAVLDVVAQHLRASPFGTIHASIFRFPQPTGSDVQERAVLHPGRLAVEDDDITGSLGARALIDTRNLDRVLLFPEVNRADKGDRLVPAQRPPPQPRKGTAIEPREVEQAVTLASVVPTEQTAASENKTAVREEDEAAAPVVAAQPPPVQLASLSTAGATAAREEERDVPAIQAAQIYFGVETMGGMIGTLQPWEPDDPLIVDADTDEKVPATAPATGGETVIAKGETSADGPHAKSPAERLGLTDTTRAKAEKCLANAIYFEARGEQVRGQIAVAQVVMNRVFSGYYPHDVCGVVYQNSHRHLACQFTFACDGIPDRVTEPDAWVRATEIARDTLDGKLWLADVGKATHYHAYWVHPWWVREMRKLDRIGVHTFYRPRNWGDGADAPVWGNDAATKEAVKKL